MNSTKIRHLYWAAALVAVVLGATVGIRLDSLDVPFWLACLSGCGVANAAVNELDRQIERLGLTTYACRTPGCDFRARLKAPSAADNRRWQEAAAAHPHHALPRT
ncbi:hypothetical protein ACFW6X_00410 [Streptomyces bacillaris]|uniref:hypothetical protein n=1 Tax=Streptomyces bacillaris TaxID=68179 RepID=UPI00367B6C2E